MSMRTRVASLSPLQRRLIEIAAASGYVKLRPGELPQARSLRQQRLVDISAAKALSLTRKGRDVATWMARR